MVFCRHDGHVKSKGVYLTLSQFATSIASQIERLLRQEQKNEAYDIPVAKYRK
jgi:hypothetical protein